MAPQMHDGLHRGLGDRTDNQPLHVPVPRKVQKIVAAANHLGEGLPKAHGVRIRAMTVGDLRRNDLSCLWWKGK